MATPKILIVDDDPAFLRQLSAVLANAGFEAITAVDVKSAQAILTRPDPGIDLLIVDLVLQGETSGFDLISTVGKKRPRFKILAASAVYRSGTTEYISGRLGANKFIEKPRTGEPIDADKWIHTIQRLVGQECSDRLALGQKLAQAVSRVYAAGTDYDTAKASRADADRLAELLAALLDARTEELKAERAYREHVENHGCLHQERSDDQTTTPAAAIRTFRHP